MIARSWRFKSSFAHQEGIISRIAKYLQEHLDGEVVDGLDARRYFSIDSSILKLQPAAVVYPRNEDDVRRVLRFCWQVAEREHKVPVTPRGGGGDESGAAIGSGVQVVLNKHLNRLLYLNPKRSVATVESGMNLDKLHQALVTHGLFLPAWSGLKNETAGGAFAGNSTSVHSGKYGPILSSVESARIVLADGETIDVSALNKSQLNQKLGLSTFEGQIYRELDSLFEEMRGVINDAREKLVGLRANSAGYNIFDVTENGDFNLLPLLAGSQGTLGVVTELTLKLHPHTSVAATAMISLSNYDKLDKILEDIMSLRPSVCEFLSGESIAEVAKFSPEFVADPDRRQAAAYLMVEFDEPSAKAQDRNMDNLRKLAGERGINVEISNDVVSQDEMRRFFAAPELLKISGDSRSSPAPIMHPAVSPEKFANFVAKVHQAFKSAGLPPAFSGSATLGRINIAPNLDISQLGDRQKLFKLTDSVARIASSMGGTVAAGGGEGRLHADKLSHIYDKKILEIMKEVKSIFDPHGILNPGVKFGSEEKDIKMMVASSYSPHHKYENF